MKTARFVDVVEASGRPDVHILLSRPEDDKVLQAAIRLHRVMTIDQDRPVEAVFDFPTLHLAIRWKVHRCDKV